MYTDHYITPAEHKIWFDRIMTSGDCHYWIIVADDTDVGLAGIFQLEPVHKRASWVFYVAHPSVRGKGIGSVVEFLVLSYVFDELGYNKLCCEVLVTNESVVAMHERFGFRQEGLFREHVIKTGKPIDVVALAMLRKEWSSYQLDIKAELQGKGLI